MAFTSCLALGRYSAYSSVSSLCLSRFYMKFHSLGDMIYPLSQSILASLTEFHKPGGLINSRNLFLTVLEAGKFMMKVPAGGVSGMSLLPGIFSQDKSENSSLFRHS